VRNNHTLSLVLSAPVHKKQFSTMATSLFTEVNNNIAGWAGDRVLELKAEIQKQGIRHIQRSASPRPSANSLKKSTRKTAGLISRIGFSIPRHMVYVHKGVGRGTTIEQVGNTKRKPKPWYNPVIDKNIDKLADIVAEGIGGSIINNLLIK
jgi:hypothetical protein